jgi:hypothetical protein
MRNHHFAGIAAVMTGIGVVIGVVVTGGHREAAGDPVTPSTTVYVKLINHCGHLILTEDGVPLEVGLTTVPPVSTDALNKEGVTLPDVRDGGIRPAPAHPPYLKAWRDPASC